MVGVAPSRTSLMVAAMPARRASSAGTIEGDRGGADMARAGVAGSCAAVRRASKWQGRLLNWRD